MDFSNPETARLFLIGLAIFTSLLVGFVFGRWTDDSAASNKLILATLVLLAIAQTGYTFLNYFPQWSKWWIIIAWPSWFSLSLWGVWLGSGWRINTEEYAHKKAVKKRLFRFPH